MELKPITADNWLECVNLWTEAENTGMQKVFLKNGSLIRLERTAGSFLPVG